MGASAERARLAEDARGAARWKLWGPYLSERQWGTVREDYSPYGNAWDYFSHDQARSRAYRWGEDGIAGISDAQPAAVPRAGFVERPRPDPEGAAVRPDQRRRQSRRGRQGALLLPRRHADPLVPEIPLQVPAGRISLRLAGRGEPPARQGPARVRADRHRRVRRRPLFRRVRRVRQGRARGHPDAGHGAQPRPEPATLHVLPQLWFRNIWSWRAERRTAPICTPTTARPSRSRASCSAATLSTPTASRRCCSATTTRMSGGCSE